MNQSPENLSQNSEVAPPVERPDVQQRLEATTLELGQYPERERRLTLSPSVQADVLDSVGLVVEDERAARLTSASVNFAASLDGLALDVGVVLTEEEEGQGPALDALDMSLDLGNVTASAYMPRYTLFPEGDGVAAPEFALNWNGNEAQGKITFVPSSEGAPRLWNAQFGTSDVLFKVAGSGDGQSFQVTTLAVESGVALGDGELRGAVSWDPTQHAGDVQVQYEVSF